MFSGAETGDETPHATESPIDFSYEGGFKSGLDSVDEFYSILQHTHAPHGSDVTDPWFPFRNAIHGLLYALLADRLFSEQEVDTILMLLQVVASFDTPLQARDLPKSAKTLLSHADRVLPNLESLVSMC